jgi:PAS domain S-box-containing protein
VNQELKEDYMDLIPQGIIFLNQERKIIYINKSAAVQFSREPEDVFNQEWKDIFPNTMVDEIYNNSEGILTFSYGENSFIVQKSSFYQESGDAGYILTIQNPSDLEEATKELDSYKNLSLDLKAIFDTSYDVIYVADGEGITMRVSSASEKLWGYKESEIVGKSVYQLEKEGVFKPSVTRLVLEKQDTVSLIQTTKTGRRLMVVGTPIKNEENKIVRVVNASRDITEVSQLKAELELLKQLTEGYRQEIMDLRTKNELDNKIIHRSEKMKKVVLFSRKIALVDSPVLLLGETGVGKEVIAAFIHSISTRKKQPFITVSCGSIPEKLLEKELFGFEHESKGNKEGKLGSIELANEGTLFLDEIEELPLSLQVKLLKVIQEKQAHAGLSQASANVRVIVSTSKDLSELVKAGKFREDLYYRLNVVPITIPPLKERREDIVPLILHFTDQLNKRYALDKKFNPRLLKKLQEYSWPGNVRELQNIIERLLVTTEGAWINEDDLPIHILNNQGGIRSIQVNRIISLREAIEHVERELLTMAQEKYSSTTKIAEVLEVNQSTISRKLQKYLI